MPTGADDERSHLKPSTDLAEPSPDLRQPEPLAEDKDAEPTEQSQDEAQSRQANEKSLWEWLTTAGEDEAPPIVILIGFVVVAAVIIWAYLADSDVPKTNKVRVVLVVTPMLVVAFIGVSLYGRSKSAKIAFAVDGLALAGSMGVIGILPALTLDRHDQLLLLKLGSIAMLSLLPGLIYLQFLVVRGEAVWDEFTETLRRLDVRDFGDVPARGQIPDADNLYRRKFEATYGRLHIASGTHRSRGRVLFPVFLLTTFVTIGWVVTLEPEVVGKVHLFRLFELTGNPGLSATALRFGFVGSYYFILQMLVRRYFQNDLKADAYWNGVLRIVTTALVAATIAVVSSDLTKQQLAATAFLIGIFPQIGVDLIRTGVVFPLQAKLKGHQAHYPLSELDGMNIWYEARLLEEGVDDLQNLKTVNWIDLFLNTRIPAGRLVDWVDQSHLLLHIGGSRSGNQDKTDRNRLRAYGIRTATDLEATFYSARLDDDTTIETIFDSEARNNENATTNDDDVKAKRATSIIRILAAEPVLKNIRAWKDQVDPADLPESVRVSSVITGQSTQVR